MNFPNLITIGRILLVPVTVWLLISGAYGWAFAVFLIAGISDGIDGYLARRLDAHTELGAYLDPLADKVLLASVYGVLGIIKILPAWLVLLVVTRDLLIIAGVLLAWVMDKPFVMKPLPISKLNTAVQIVFIVAVLGICATEFTAAPIIPWGSLLVAMLTIASGAFYIRDWVLHMNNTGDSS